MFVTGSHNPRGVVTLSQIVLSLTHAVENPATGVRVVSVTEIRSAWAFESLVRRHERRVFRVTLAVLGNAEDAEEAMQDAFVKAYRHLGPGLLIANEKKSKLRCDTTIT